MYTLSVFILSINMKKFNEKINIFHESVYSNK